MLHRKEKRSIWSLFFFSLFTVFFFFLFNHVYRNYASCFLWTGIERHYFCNWCICMCVYVFFFSSLDEWVNDNETILTLAGKWHSMITKKNLNGNASFFFSLSSPPPPSLSRDTFLVRGFLTSRIWGDFQSFQQSWISRDARRLSLEGITRDNRQAPNTPSMKREGDRTRVRQCLGNVSTDQLWN